MKLSELIREIGDEKVTFQVLSRCLAGVKNGKKDSRVEFFTSNENGQAIARQAAGVEPLENEALIIWVPRGKFVEVLDSLKPAGSKLSYDKEKQSIMQGSKDTGITMQDTVL